MTNPTARLPAKLHRRVCLVLTEDAVLAEELLARKKLSAEVAGRLYATTASGLYRSTDEGLVWVRALSDLDRSWGGDLAVLPGPTDVLLLALAHGAGRGGDGVGDGADDLGAAAFREVGDALNQLGHDNSE